MTKFSGNPSPVNFKITKDVFREGMSPDKRENVLIKKGQAIPQLNKITPYGSTGNTKLLEAMGYYRVPDCGQTTYILELKE